MNDKYGLVTNRSGLLDFAQNAKLVVQATYYIRHPVRRIRVRAMINYDPQALRQNDPNEPVLLKTSIGGVQEEACPMITNSNQWSEGWLYFQEPKNVYGVVDLQVFRSDGTAMQATQNGALAINLTFFEK